MESQSVTKELAYDFVPFLKVYKDGSYERYKMFGNIYYVPPGLDPVTGVQTKDVVIFPETGVFVRLFLPKIDHPDQKLPLVVHYHGGGFCDGSPDDSAITGYLSTLVSETNVLAVSVGFRRAPENPLPAAYEDAVEAFKWVISRTDGCSPDPWLTQHADLGRLFLAGESSGANIAHYVAIQAGVSGIAESDEAVAAGLKIKGLLIVHPFFGINDPIQNMLYMYLYPTSPGFDKDPKLNPAVDPDLPRLACDRVLVCLAEKDWIRDRGVAYYETLCKSEWGGKVELEDAAGEDHCFHLFKEDQTAKLLLMKRMAKFFNGDHDHQQTVRSAG